jgi:hypothetical protein
MIESESHQRLSNPYEVSPCQEINYPSERFFSAFRVPVASAIGLVF